MSAFKRVCLIGLGEVGQILAEDLRKAGVAQISAYDILSGDADGAPSKAAARLELPLSGSAPEAAKGAQLIISAVTAAADVDAARSVAGALEPGAYFLDLNSASPGAKRASFDVIHSGGGRYVESAVMTPFPPKRLASAMLIGGPHGRDFLTNADGLFPKANFFSESVGQAAAAKLCRSVMIKGVEALVTESMLAARHYGVEHHVLSSLSDLLPVGDWEALARYMISRSIEHGARRAEEMREAARTMAEAGVEPVMSDSIARRQDWAAAYKTVSAPDDLHAMLDGVRAAMPVLKV